MGMATTDIVKEKSDIGVIIARFQVPDLHVGHKTLIARVIDNHNKILILLGTSPTIGTKNNPLDFATRAKMVQSFIDDDEFLFTKDKIISIQPIMDCPSNVTWANNLNSIIRTNFPLGTVLLYGGRDSFIDSYKRTNVRPSFACCYIDTIIAESGTDLRKATGKRILDSSDFRSGIIHATQNRYPITYPTVDLAVTKENKYVLMGKKEGLDGWCFPGGFVDPHDENYETAALREFREEITGLEISPDLNYIGSFTVDDWRYKLETENIKTILFQTEYIFGGFSTKEEFFELAWVDMRATHLEKIAKSHQPLYKTLIKYMNTRRK